MDLDLDLDLVLKFPPDLGLNLNMAGFARHCTKGKDNHLPIHGLINLL